jgi:murein L,D-transpeptidase YafK
MHKPFCGRMPLLLILAMCPFAFSPNDGLRSNVNPSPDDRSSEQNVRRMIENSFGRFSGEYIILVRKSAFTLEIVNRNNKVVAGYPIAYGRNPDKKAPLYGGDNRTPEGEYNISVILSNDADTTTSSCRRLAKMNRIFWRAKDGHSKFNNPGEDQGDNAFGPRDFHISYPNADDIQKYRRSVKESKIPIVNGKPLTLSHRYDIHGNCDKRSIGHLATSGCIRMDNSDIVDMDKYVQIGTPVIILPADE